MQLAFTPWRHGARVVVDGEAIAFLSSARRCQSCLGSGLLALPFHAPCFPARGTKPCPDCGGRGRGGYTLTGIEGDFIGCYPTLAAAERALAETWP